uniref:Uncharacterized protein n=1 Tax=Anguilla anguilla TaxID=7936 RepID=A0A0E9PPG7_ANGAN
MKHAECNNTPVKVSPINTIQKYLLI